MSTVSPVLSRREREVAALVAQGLSNRDIAQRLFISERTAEGHVEQIRNKLGFKSRSQVAAWVASDSTRLAAAPAPPPTQSIRTPSKPRIRPWWLWRIGVLTVVASAGILAFAVVRPTLIASPSAGPRITTFAGTGHAAVSQDGSKPSNTDLATIGGIAVSPNGDVYLADASARWPRVQGSRDAYLVFALLERGRHDRPDVLGIQTGFPGGSHPALETSP